MKIFICDDNKIIHSEIKQLLNDFADSENHFDIVSVFSGEELLQHTNMDIIFLDIEMDGMNGIEVAEKIREKDKNAIIIFVSNHSNYVFDTFRFEALHFIVKPIQKDEFNNVFQRALAKYRATHMYLSLKWRYDRDKILIDDVSFVEGYQRHIIVYTIDGGKYEAVGKLAEIFKTLEPYGFVQVHQGYIVNMNYIKHFDTQDVILNDGTEIMISVRKRNEALQTFDKFLKTRRW